MWPRRADEIFFSFAAPFTGRSSLSLDRLELLELLEHFVLCSAAAARAADQNFNFLLFCGLTNAVCTRCTEHRMDDKVFFLVFAMLAGHSSRCAQWRNDRVSTIRPRASSQPQFLLAQLRSPTVYCVSIYLAKNHYFPLEIMISPIIFRSLTLRIIHYILTVLFFLLRQKNVVSRFSLLRCVELTA